MTQMTLNSLKKRLDELITENEQRGWSNRNELPLVLRLGARTAIGRDRSQLIGIDYLSGAQLSWGDYNCMTINADAKNVIKKAGAR